MRRLLSFLAVLTVAFCASSAYADSFELTFHTANNDVAGTFTVTGGLYAPGEYYITSASGTIDGNSVSLLPANMGNNPGDVSTEPNSGYTYDNIYYTSGDPFDGNGIMLQSGNLIYNFYAPYTLTAITGGTPGMPKNVVYDYNGPVTTVPSVPEPSSLVLLGTGALGLAGAARRRFRA